MKVTYFGRAGISLWGHGWWFHYWPPRVWLPLSVREGLRGRKGWWGAAHLVRRDLP